jgi:hypothetical protein
VPAPAASKGPQQPQGANPAAVADKPDIWDLYERQQQQRMAKYWRRK